MRLNTDFFLHLSTECMKMAMLAAFSSKMSTFFPCWKGNANKQANRFFFGGHKDVCRCNQNGYVYIM